MEGNFASTVLNLFVPTRQKTHIQSRRLRLQLAEREMFNLKITKSLNIKKRKCGEGKA